MKYVRISQDVWVNLELIESVVRNSDGTALLQGRGRVYESTIPFEAIPMIERESEPQAQQVASPLTTLTSDTQPAW
jgi:hypothetical protein